MKTFYSIIIVAILLVGGYLAYPIINKAVVGSVTQGNEYRYKTLGTGSNPVQTIKGSAGTLGSVIITAAGAGEFAFYEATTTNANKRTIKATTSLPIVASFPTNATVGTYTFDLSYSSGLIAEWKGAIGSTTITYR